MSTIDGGVNDTIYQTCAFLLLAINSGIFTPCYELFKFCKEAKLIGKSSSFLANNPVVENEYEIPKDPESKEEDKKEEEKKEEEKKV